MGTIANALGGVGGTTGYPGLKPEPIEGNSLTQYLRSVNNQQGQQGNAAFQAGGGLLQAGGGVIDKGISTLQQPLDYWSALLSGDKKAMGNAVGPYSSAVSKQFDGANRAASTMLPRGGYRSAIQAELPNQKAGLISDKLLSLQPQAAQQVTGIGQLLSSLGLDVGKLGLSEQGLGQSILGQLLQSLLGGRGQDVTEHGQAMQLAGSTANTAGNLLVGG